MADSASTGPLAERHVAILGSLADLEDTLGRHREALSGGAWRPGEVAETLERLVDQVAATRRAVEALEQARQDERRQLGHDVRGVLNTIACWVQILRLERNGSEQVARAADVLERNVRALTGMIEPFHR